MKETKLWDREAAWKKFLATMEKGIDYRNSYGQGHDKVKLKDKTDEKLAKDVNDQY